MSNFYDLETDLEVEDVASDEAQYDEYEEIEEFGAYDEADAMAKWGEMDFEQLVAELEDMVARAKKFIFSKKKRIVDGEEMSHLSQYILDKFPGEISAANDVLARKEKILTDANAEKRDTMNAMVDYNVLQLYVTYNYNYLYTRGTAASEKNYVDSAGITVFLSKDTDGNWYDYDLDTSAFKALTLA